LELLLTAATAKQENVAKSVTVTEYSHVIILRGLLVSTRFDFLTNSYLRRKQYVTTAAQTAPTTDPATLAPILTPCPVVESQKLFTHMPPEAMNGELQPVQAPVLSQV
jgi:hypothetical protein